MAGGAATIGGPFALTDGAGRRVTDAEAITGPTLVYFGYTFCPDVCPMDLSRNALAAAELAERGTKVGQVFITIDPARDTPEVVRDFAAAIDPGLVGLTGTAEEVAAAAAAYKVYYRKSGDDPDYYLMDHSTFTYLMAPGDGVPRVLPLGGDPRGRWPTRWRAMPPGSDPAGAPPLGVRCSPAGARAGPLAPHPRRRRAVPAPAGPGDGEARLRGHGGQFGGRGAGGGGEPAAGLCRGRPAARGRQRARGGRRAARSGGRTRGSWC